MKTETRLNWPYIAERLVQRFPEKFRFHETNVGLRFGGLIEFRDNSGGAWRWSDPYSLDYLESVAELLDIFAWCEMERFGHWVGVCAPRYGVLGERRDGDGFLATKTARTYPAQHEAKLAIIAEVLKMYEAAREN